MSSGSLFEPESKSGSNKKTILIGLLAFIVLSGAGFGLYHMSAPAVRTAGEIAEQEIRDVTVALLAQPGFTGEEFRQQILGKGRLARFAWDKKEAYFTFPEADEQEFEEFLSKYFFDKAKIEFSGAPINGRSILGNYKFTVSSEQAKIFKTPLNNIRIEPRQAVTFTFNGVSYTASLDELKNLTNNSQLYGGRMITQVPGSNEQSMIVFANHAIMVAKPGEPSLGRLTEELLKDVAPNREARIQRLVDFVSSEIEYSYTEAVGARETLKRASETLMTRSADCSNKTILLASLLEQIGEEYVLLYCPQHITVAVPQGNYPNENGLDFTWSGKPWAIAETTLPGFQVGFTKVAEPKRLTTVQYVQDPKLSHVIFDANSLELLKFL